MTGGGGGSDNLHICMTSLMDDLFKASYSFEVLNLEVIEIKITTRQVKARFSECTKHPMYKIGNNNATVCSTQIRGVGAPLTGCKSE